MNERIKEFRFKAAEYANEQKPLGITKWNEMRDEKFAELIVLEMCTVLDRAQWDKGEDWVCADGTRIIPAVKNHFGVEE